MASQPLPAPNFTALYARIKRMVCEQPETVIASSVPFLINKDGTLSQKPCGSPYLLNVEQVEKKDHVLNFEVEVIWDNIAEGRYPPSDVSDLETWSEAAIKLVECACDQYDRIMATQLRQMNLLH